MEQDMTHPAGVTHVHYQNETIGPFDLNLIYQRINSGEWSTAQVYHFERGEWLSAQSFMESTTITQFKTEAPISDVAHVHIQGETIGPFSTGQIHMRIISGEWASALIFNAEDG